jgi:2-oxo-4-hydroxy-4-carboxy--5-ureidoimidazoline (OHCU) decarboxylase
MSTARLNITLPEDVYRMLAGIKNKSSYIAEAIREKRHMEDRENLNRALAAAYREAALEDYETYKVWEDTLKDGLEE